MFLFSIAGFDGLSRRKGFWRFHLLRCESARRNPIGQWPAVVIIWLFLTASAYAQLNPIRDLQSWIAQPTMTGDWGGLRTELLEHGITVQLSYTGEVAHNTNGLYGIATDYAQSVTFGADVNLGQLGIDPGGISHVRLTERAGRDLGPEKLGSLFQTFDAFGQGRNVRLSEISLEQALDRGLLNAKVGFFPMAGTDVKEFDWLPAFGDFITNGHHPLAMAYGSGWDYFPAGHWGARFRLSPSERFYVNAGIFQVNPSYYLDQNGFKLDFQGNTGVMFPLEVTYRPSFDPRLAGIYKLGAYFDTSSAPDESMPAKRDTGREGLYFEFQQRIYSEPANPVRGLTIFGYYAAADENTALLNRNYHFGLSYQGTFPGRDLDTVNVGWFAADINPRRTAFEESTGAPVQSATEGLLEINYGAVLGPWLHLKPAVQYAVDPGGIASHPNAWVFLFQTQVIF